MFCALALLACELISHPFAEMGICDDWSYILTAHRLASTGHIVYVGWAAAMLGWQLYLGALFIKLFGFSHTTVRFATLFVAMASAFLLQRCMVRLKITERNATIGTLAFVLSPLFLELSVTFMSDIYGIFAIVLCLYLCLRALQASTPVRAIAWLCFAVLTNAIGGSARQIAWLGVLVMVPSTLWLLFPRLRTQRPILLAGIAANIAGIFFVFACMRWFQHQPYSLPSLPPHLFSRSYPFARTLREFLYSGLEVPFLLLPLFGLFLPELRKASRRTLVILSLTALFYASRIFHYRQFKLNSMLEPTQGDWVTVHGIYGGTFLHGIPPLLIHPLAQLILTILALGGLLGLIASLTRLGSTSRPPTTPLETPNPTHTQIPSAVSWLQITILLGPFTLASIVLLVPVATVALFDRYLLGLLLVLTISLVRFYQERVQPRLPAFSIALVILMATLGLAITHNIFSLYRARVALAAELSAAGVPATSVDLGWEANMPTEIEHATYINYWLIVFPKRVYLPVVPPPGSCDMFWYDLTPHVHPIYAVSFEPDACAGPARFAPVPYSRWLASPANLYAVKFTPNAP